MLLNLFTFLLQALYKIIFFILSAIIHLFTLDLFVTIQLLLQVVILLSQFSQLGI